MSPCPFQLKCLWLFFSYEITIPVTWRVQQMESSVLHTPETKTRWLWKNWKMPDPWSKAAEALQGVRWESFPAVRETDSQEKAGWPRGVAPNGKSTWLLPEPYFTFTGPTIEREKDFGSLYPLQTSQVTENLAEGKTLLPEELWTPTILIENQIHHRSAQQRDATVHWHEHGPDRQKVKM